MEEKTKKQSKISELRQDLVTGDWVVIATGRSKKPEDFILHKEEQVNVNINNENKTCVFCEPEKTEQEKDVLIYKKDNDDWSLRVFPNKYPAFSRGRTVKHFEEGPYFGMDGVGYHEVIVTQDHEKQIAKLDVFAVAEIIDAYQNRYIDLMNKKSVNFIEIFHNHGKEAGASISHPHSQLAAIPVISPYIKGELDGAESYYKANKECVYCVMNEWECESQKRIIFENEEFVAYCPFSSRVAFEVWIVPKKHQPYFERITDKQKVDLAEALQNSISKIYTALGNPPYNFYVHTAPCDGKDYPHYHWHIEILPHTSVWAGFELSTGIEIATIEPEKAAEYLRTFL
jgi:UDPglucose--hexose-1-phosphate uridylyltransferase